MALVLQRIETLKLKISEVSIRFRNRIIVRDRIRVRVRDRIQNRERLDGPSFTKNRDSKAQD
jgi:hypothetical protein